MKLNKLNIEAERRDTMSPSNLYPELLVTKQTGINPVGWIHYWNLISLKKKSRTMIRLVFCTLLLINK